MTTLAEVASSSITSSSKYKVPLRIDTPDGLLGVDADGSSYVNASVESGDADFHGIVDVRHLLPVPAKGVRIILESLSHSGYFIAYNDGRLFAEKVNDKSTPPKECLFQYISIGDGAKLYWTGDGGLCLVNDVTVAPDLKKKA